MPTIAHLTCVCASKEGIKTALADMKNAGIENILALRGDIPKNYDGQVFAEFSHASELVELIKETGDFCVGGACYPEVHPDSANKHEDIIGLKKRSMLDVIISRPRCSSTTTYSLISCTESERREYQCRSYRALCL